MRFIKVFWPVQQAWNTLIFIIVFHLRDFRLEINEKMPWKGFLLKFSRYSNEKIKI